MDDSIDLARPDRVGPALAQATGDERWHTARAELIVGGHSNLTYRLHSAAGELILRRPPSGGILATAHDMGREARVQRALAGSAVPVPEIVLEDGGDLIGAPFYVMTRVPGLIIKDRLPPFYTPDDCWRLGETLADVLADLHTVDPAAVGLGQFGRPEGFTARQVRRWRRQIAATPAKPVPALDVLADRLEATVPVSPPAAIVHGDYRLDNCLVSASEPGLLTGVLDWEMSTLGDPLTDVGMLMCYWGPIARLGSGLAQSVTVRPGFPDASQIAERWSARTGIGLERIAWYQAFAHFKFAGIVLGIQARVAAGAMGGQEFTGLDGTADLLAQAGLELAGGASAPDHPPDHG